MSLNIGGHLIFLQSIYFQEVYYLGDFGAGFVVFIYICS